MALGLAALAVGALGMSTILSRLGGQASYEERSADSLRALADAGRVRVEVLNGSGQPGAGSSVANVLREGGLEVIGIRNADRYDYPRTLVVARSRNPGCARAVARRLGGSQIIRQRAPLDWDVTVVVGRDQARERPDLP